VTWLAPELVAEIAPRLGLELHLEPTYGYVGQLVAADGRRFYFRNSCLDVNPQGAAELARDKAYCAYFLRRMGYPVPDGETFYSDHWCQVIGSDRDATAAYSYAKAITFPVVVKPNRKSNGVGVSIARSRRELERGLRAVFGHAGDPVALVQPVIPGLDLRIVVLDREVVVAYRRAPLSVVGDGRSTLAELLQQKLETLRQAGRRVAPLAGDFRVRARLKRLGLTPRSVPGDGQVVVVRDIANLSAGGEAEDVSDLLHPGYRELAARATRDLGLRYCGVDVLTAGPVDRPPEQYVILEMNPSPGLDHFARLGPMQRSAAARLYEQLLRLMVAR
jgi:D-alanine-D-alanine ligase-like ATP-grasp enzyme